MDQTGNYYVQKNCRIKTTGYIKCLKEKIVKKKYVYLLMLTAVIIMGSFVISMIVAPNETAGKITEKPVPTVENPIEKPEELSFENPVETPVEEPVEEKGPKELYHLKIGDVISVEYISDQKKLSIVKTGTQWSVNGDKYSRIDQNKVISAIDKFLIVDSIKTVSFSDTDREQWGISNSTNLIQIKTTDRQFTLLLGSLNKEKTGYYLQIQETDEIYLVKNSIGESLQLKLDDLRDRNLVLFDKTQIETLYIKNEKEIRIIPYKRSDMFTEDKFTFMLEAPYSAYVPVSSRGFNDFLDSMNQTIQIMDFIDGGNPEEYGIDEQSWSLTIKQKNGQLKKLLIGSDAGASKVYGKLSEEKQIFTISRKDLPFLSLKPFDLVHKLPHSISMDTIDTFMITKDDLAVMGALDRHGDRDSYSINGIETEEKIFVYLYGETQKLTLAGEVRKTVNTEKPEIIISYKLYDGGSLWTHLNFYPYDDEYYALSRNEDDPLFTIKKLELQKMLEDVTLTVDKLMGF